MLQRYGQVTTRLRIDNIIFFGLSKTPNIKRGESYKVYIVKMKLLEKLKPLKEELENQRCQYQLVSLPGEMSRTWDELEKTEEAQAGGKH